MFHSGNNPKIVYKLHNSVVKLIYGSIELKNCRKKQLVLIIDHCLLCRVDAFHSIQIMIKTFCCDFKYMENFNLFYITLSIKPFNLINKIMKSKWIKSESRWVPFLLTGTFRLLVTVSFSVQIAYAYATIKSVQFVVSRIRITSNYTIFWIASSFSIF